MPTSTRFLSLALSTMLLAGCLGNSHGIRVTTDGRLVPQTPETVRTDVAATISSQLQDQLGPGWQVSTTVDPAPAWEAVEADEFGWSSVQVRIRCEGPGAPPAGFEAEPVAEAVRDYLRRRVAPPVATTVAVSVEYASAPAAVAPPNPVAAAAGQRTYVVQPGDTLADISAVCLGAAERWRELVDANPGLDPGRLQPGQRLVIPPLVTTGSSSTSP